VEDDGLLAEAACDYFASKGWEVETEDDGAQALDGMGEIGVFYD